MKENLSELRRSYRLGELHRKDLNANPFEQFSLWFGQALEAGLTEPNALTLSTSTRAGRPSSRIVLLKEFNDEGFSFYTNFNSRKGQEIADNPYVALLFPWIELERQVRIEGFATKTSDEEAENYFRIRPEGSRLGAWVSEQSSIIPSRKTLDERLALYQQQFADGEIPRPDHWGGYLVKPMMFEFWQGRENRLHDRFIYTRDNSTWNIERLSP